MPIVTVIIPTYNRGYIVKRAIDSLLAQSLTDFEVIIVDDGSTDDTRLVVESIKDARIRYIYKP
ncbi:MAG: glycosyltransferase family A protein, partial [Sedimentisphaerales bacterium]